MLAVNIKEQLAGRAHLQQQAFGQAASADAGWVEFLDALQRPLDQVIVLAHLEADVFDGNVKVPVLVHEGPVNRGKPWIEAEIALIRG